MTVIARRVVSEPIRLASETWTVIVNLLTPEADNKAREELLAVIGVVSSLIAAETMKNSPIVVYGSSPRVRIYCLYGEDAITGEDANEAKLAMSPISGNWSISLPCSDSDLEWVQATLKKLSIRISARDMNTSVEEDDRSSPAEKSASIDNEAFFRS